MSAEQDAADRWQRLSRLFEELLELDVDGRAQRIGALKQAEPETALKLRRMLEAHRAPPATLDADWRVAMQATSHTGDEAPAEAPSDRSGEGIDEYRLLRRVGRGGMGEVYLAERTGGDFAQRVALKLLRRGIDTEDVIKRFVQERSILARLEHPGIARLIDGGVAGEGLPFLVMEFVEGEPLTAYARAHDLDVEARLRLLIAVCEAVDFAHRRLVVHRDLKPSNVLVTADGSVKLLDFGIAKLLDADAGDETLTGTGMRVLSPAYAAPEQFLGEPIGTATDVYSLGVLLFELLTGELPHQRTARSLDVLAQNVTQERVEKPSVVLRRQSHTETARRARRLEGDLDTIALTALKREPERRYGSAAALAQDLRAYLDGRPIAARADTFGYRAGKFVRRNRIAVGSASLVLLAILAGLGIALWQTQVAQAEARRADAQTRVAELAAARASHIKEFVLALFREQDPLTRATAKATTAGDLVARGIAQARRDFASEPELQAEIVHELAEIQFNLGDLPEARRNLEQVVESRKRNAGAESIAYASALADLGGVQQAMGDKEPATRSIEESVALLRKLAGPDHIETANAEMRLTRLEFERGKPEEALALAEHVHRIYVRERGTDHMETLRRLYTVGVTLEQLDRLPEAEQTFRKVLAGYEKHAGPDHVQTVYPRALLGDILRRQRRYAEAVPVYDKALAVARAQVGDDHPKIAVVGMRRADLLRRLRRYDEAEAALVDAERVFLKTGAPDLGQVYVYRGDLNRELHRYPLAIEFYSRAVRHYGKTIGPDNVFTRSAELSLAGTRAEAGDLERAVREASAAATAIRSHALPDSYDVAFAAESLGDTLAIAGQHAEALEQHRQALAMMRKLYNSEHGGVATLEVAVSADLHSLGSDPSEARSLLDHALAVMRKDDDSNPEIGEALLLGARLARAAGDASRARGEVVEASRRLRVSHGPDHALTREAEALLARTEA